MALHFNVNGAINEFLNLLKPEIESACIQWEIEANSKVRNKYYGEYSNDNINAKFDSEVKNTIKNNSRMVIAFLEANTFALADSYGTGSFMLESNPGFQEYRKTWHSDRHSKAIVGRKKGEYTDIFGKPHRTSGAFQGQNIEGKKVNSTNKIRGAKTITGYFIQPMHPSYAIQMAENWLYKTYLPKAYNIAIKKLNLSRFLIED